MLASLTSAFWAYFMYLWKTWDNGKRDTNSGPGPYVTSEEERELREQQKRNLSKDDLNGNDDISLPEVNQVMSEVCMEDFVIVFISFFTITNFN